MSFTKSITIIGEGHYGSMRTEPILGDPYAFMDHTPIYQEPIADGKIRRAMSRKNQEFVRSIERDVAAGTFNPKAILERLSSRRQKSA